MSSAKRFAVLAGVVIAVSSLTGVASLAEVGGTPAVTVSGSAQRVEDTSARKLLNEVIAAHGGIERYRKFGGMKYKTVGFPLTPFVAKPNTSTVDLVSRNNRIDGVDFSVGFDGKTAWSKPGIESVGLPARFFSLGSFYFIGMPFVFADGGVVLTDKGTQTYRGKEYRVIGASYGTGTGFSEQDDYDLFVDPVTKRLGLINHSVTEIGVERVTWEFPEWQTVEGLLVPQKMVYFGGFSPNPKEEGKVTIVSEVKFSSNRPAASTYAAPEGAKVEVK